eukprot:6211825-Pleurochrysis_carterae.AAC.2
MDDGLTQLCPLSLQSGTPHTLQVTHTSVSVSCQVCQSLIMLDCLNCLKYIMACMLHGVHSQSHQSHAHREWPQPAPQKR